MAKRHSEPAEPVGVGTERITKRAGYGHYGSDEQSSRVREPGLTGREPFQGEQRLPPSPAKAMERQWASASYDPYGGRAARVADDPYPHQNSTKTSNHGVRDGKPEGWKQMTKAGTHTESPPQEPRQRPGRW